MIDFGERILDMRATLDLVKEKFNCFNNLMFEGKLKQLPFRISDSRHSLGRVAFVRVRQPDGTFRFSEFVFYVSRRFELEERILEDIIIHEMIHYYILVNQLQDTSPHGIIFRQKMDEINRRFGRNISISIKSSLSMELSDNKKKFHAICLSEIADGRKLVTVTNFSPMLFRIWKSIEENPMVTRFHWVASSDPYFNMIPHSRTPKFYRIPSEELLPHLRDARELIRSGSAISFGPLVDLDGLKSLL